MVFSRSLICAAAVLGMMAGSAYAATLDPSALLRDFNTIALGM